MSSACCPPRQLRHHAPSRCVYPSHPHPCAPVSLSLSLTPTHPFPTHTQCPPVMETTSHFTNNSSCPSVSPAPHTLTAPPQPSATSHIPLSLVLPRLCSVGPSLAWPQRRFWTAFCLSICHIFLQKRGTGRKGKLRTEEGGGRRGPGSILLLRASPCRVGPRSLGGQQKLIRGDR